MRTIEHELEVPLDHAAKGGPTLTVFAREVVADGGEDRPLLVYLAGGPGHEAPRPRRVAGRPGWIDRALEEFRVLLVDQRGTGRSTPIGPELPGTPEEQAAYLTHFRADSIVRDLERLRKALDSPPWTVLGQSFGGFCTVAYLSLAPEGLREALITGGLPVLGPGRVDEVYALTWRAVAARTERFFDRYPADRERFAAHVAAGPFPRDRLRLAGLDLGASFGEDALHHLLELPPRSPAFVHDVEAGLPYVRNPLYAVLHESCWADGGATRWAAARTEPDGDHLLGEHVLPWIFDELPGLRPLREAAQRLAEHDWPRLHDPAVLAENAVPVAALVLADDLYVPRALSEETAGAIRGCRVWLTNELEHDAIHADGARVLGRLLDMARDRV